MEFKANNDVQCLDETGVWREATVIKIVNNSYEVQFKNYKSKFNGLYDKSKFHFIFLFHLMINSINIKC
jgi:hypothetical protein